MSELPGKIRVQDATLANMVTLAAILEYLEAADPGCKDKIDARAQEIARLMKQGVDDLEKEREGSEPSEEELG